jgi:hypothetical protein
MIPKEQLMDYVRLRIPGFEEPWSEHLRAWGEEKRGLCSDVEVLTDYTAQLVDSGTEEQLREVFDLVEELLAQGDADVQNLLATCFVESLINLASNGRISAQRFAPLLGPRSRQRCKAWDEFTGVPGPW